MRILSFIHTCTDEVFNILIPRGVGIETASARHHSRVPHETRGPSSIGPRAHNLFPLSLSLSCECALAGVVWFAPLLLLENANQFRPGWFVLQHRSARCSHFFQGPSIYDFFPFSFASSLATS